MLLKSDKKKFPKTKFIFSKGNFIKIFIFIFYSSFLITVSSSIGQEYLKKFIRRFGLVELKDDIKHKIKYITKPKKVLNVAPNWINSLSNEIDNIYIDINYSNFNNLVKKREEALRKGVLVSKKDDFVNASIRNNERTIKARIRLKGDWTDHLKDPKKWSFRVKLKNDEVLYGMNKFSLHHPYTRNYIWESVFHKFLKEKELPFLKYKFINLIVNGDNLGVYALEQHFDKILIESNKYKEGPILALQEDFIWNNIAESNNQKKYLTYDENQAYFSSQIKVFKEKKIFKDPFLAESFLKGSNILREFKLGNLKTTEAFSKKEISKFFAITDLVNSWHSTRWHNQRFYYDPYSMKLLPIGFDSMSGGIDGREVLRELSIERFTNGKWQELPFFKDLDFVEAYLKELNSLTEDEFLTNFLNKNEDILRQEIKQIHRTYPHQLNFKEVIKLLTLNQSIITKNLYPQYDLLDSYIQDGKGYKSLSIGNRYHLPIEILGLKYKGKYLKKFNKKEILKAKSKDEFINYKEFSLSKDLIVLEDEPIFLEYKILGIPKIYNYEVKNIKNIIKKGISYENEFKSSAFKEIFLFDESSREITFRKKFNIVNKPIIIPSGLLLKVNPGQKIIFEKDGYLYSQSPLYFLGKKEKPIIISGQSVGNINVVDTNLKSKLNNVIFEGLSTSNSDDLPFTGAINFYNADVEIKNCTFSSNLSEDNINIVRSKFLIQNSNFNNSASDAIDIDFSEGKLKNILVTNSGNDGIDFSGSQMVAENITVLQSGDKAISIGEASNVKLLNSVLRNNYIALAVKDGSILYGREIEAKNNNYQFTIFKKKKEYKYPSAIIENYKNLSKENLYLLGESSILKVNKKIYSSNTKNKIINSLLYDKK